MDRYHINFTRVALDDLKYIYNYIKLSLRAPIAAEKSLSTIEKEIYSLDTFPHRHKTIDEVPWGARGLENYLF